MYSIRWYTATHPGNLLVGDRDSILALANLLEGRQIQFKVADVQGFMLSQEQMGVGSFRYWLNPGQAFTE